MQKNPDNLEFPFSTLDTGRLLTPADKFYVRTHFEVPELDAKNWRLKVEGAVNQPFEIDFDELRRLPARTITALLECAGNGRVMLDPPQTGIRWELGGVGTAEWTGVPLAALLERAGVKPQGVEVVLEGFDAGEFKPPQLPTPGKIHYARSLPLAKAGKADEVILAWAMNGGDLAPRHGHPVRAVVAGWYGMASVKWLRRILVIDHHFPGFFQTMDYAIWERRDGLPRLVPVTEIQVKSQIARPAPFETVPKGSAYSMFGAAWAGESQIVRVEISDDGGRNWNEARLIGEPVRFAWRFWKYDWRTPEKPGRYFVMARATDEKGRTQPMKRDPDMRNMVIHHALPIEVQVR